MGRAGRCTLVGLAAFAAACAAHPEAEQARKTFSPYARKYPVRAYFGDTHLGVAHPVYARAATADRMKTPAATKKATKPARAGN
jgi:hypothetical protein